MDLSGFIPVFQEEVLEQKLNVKMVASSYLEGDCLVGVEVDMSVAVCWAQNDHQHDNYQAPDANRHY